MLLELWDCRLRLWIVPKNSFGSGSAQEGPTSKMQVAFRPRSNSGNRPERKQELRGSRIDVRVWSVDVLENQVVVVMASESPGALVNAGAPFIDGDNLGHIPWQFSHITSLDFFQCRITYNRGIIQPFVNVISLSNPFQECLTYDVAIVHDLELGRLSGQRWHLTLPVCISNLLPDLLYVFHGRLDFTSLHNP